MSADQAPIYVAAPGAKHGVLPEWAQDLLRKAASIDPDTPTGESLERRVEVDKATARVRKALPHLFH